MLLDFGELTDGALVEGDGDNGSLCAASFAFSASACFSTSLAFFPACVASYEAVAAPTPIGDAAFGEKVAVIAAANHISAAVSPNIF